MRSIIYFVVLIILFQVNNSFKNPGYAWLISSIIIVSIFVPFVMRYTYISYRLVNIKAMGKRLVKFSFPVLLNELGDVILGNMDVIFLTYFLTFTEVGIYSAILPTCLMQIFSKE